MKSSFFQVSVFLSFLGGFSSVLRKKIGFFYSIADVVGFITGNWNGPSMASVDETDRAILSALRENSRQPYVDLAKAVGVSERTIRTRVRRLEEDGVIRSYTIREKGIGLTALVRMKVGPGVVRSYTIREKGIGLTALVRMKVGPGVEIGSLAGEFANWSGVESVYEISGEADLVAVVHVADTSSLRELLDRMWFAAPAEIASTTTELVLEQY